MEEPFDIIAQIGSTQYTFSVYPSWDEEKKDSFFTIGLDGVDLGVIHRTNNDNWVWLEGGFAQVEADQIGFKIDAHYD